MLGQVLEFESPRQRARSGPDQDYKAAFVEATALASMLTRETDILVAARRIVSSIMAMTNSSRAVLLAPRDGELTKIADSNSCDEGAPTSKTSTALSSRDLPLALLRAAVDGSAAVRHPAPFRDRSLSGGYLPPDGVGYALCIPMVARGELCGLLYIEALPSASPAEEFDRAFLELVASQSAGALDRFASHEREAVSDATTLALSDEVKRLQVSAERMSRLASGGEWRWDTERNTMWLSAELRLALGLPAASRPEGRSIWSLGEESAAGIPDLVLQALEARRPFKAMHRVYDPKERSCTSFAVIGEPSAREGEYVGFAFALGDADMAIEETTTTSRASAAVVAFDSEALSRPQLVHALTCILLDANAGSRWLRREEPDLAMIAKSLARIEQEALRLAEFTR